jgi:flagella basal body P-ring formation protein FlgA
MLRRLLQIAGMVACAALALVVAPAWAGEVAVVATRVVYPGEVIQPKMVEEVPLVRGNRKLGPIFQDARLLYGKISTRTMLPGRLIPSTAVRDAYLVDTGQPVEALLVDGAMVISITAVPLEPGAAGDVVKLRNVDSGRIFSGIVMAEGTVRVGAS